MKLKVTYVWKRKIYRLIAVCGLIPFTVVIVIRLGNLLFLFYGLAVLKKPIEERADTQFLASQIDNDLTRKNQFEKMFQKSRNLCSWVRFTHEENQHFENDLFGMFSVCDEVLNTFGCHHHHTSPPSVTSYAFKKKDDLFRPHLIVFSTVFQIVFVHLVYNLFLIRYSLSN